MNRKKNEDGALFLEGSATYSAPKPAYVDSYEGAARRLSEKIRNRAPFRYDAGRDPLYRDYRDRTVQEGKLAMRDTQGRAAALTGGYASTYAEGAGQQAFDAYLKRLGEVLPELYAMAYQRYSDEGEALRADYDSLTQEREREYQRYRDALGDWEQERDFAFRQSAEDYKRMAEAYRLEQEAQAAEARREQTEYERRRDAYSRLYKAIRETGYVPEQSELEAAGMSRAEAKALEAEYRRGEKLDERGMAVKEQKAGISSYDGSDDVLIWNGYDPILGAWYYQK